MPDPSIHGERHGMLLTLRTLAAYECVHDTDECGIFTERPERLLQKVVRQTPEQRGIEAVDIPVQGVARNEEDDPGDGVDQLLASLHIDAQGSGDGLLVLHLAEEHASERLVLLPEVQDGTPGVSIRWLVRWWKRLPVV